MSKNSNYNKLNLNVDAYLRSADTNKVSPQPCPGDTIRLKSGKELVADVLRIDFKGIHFRKKNLAANIQNLKLKYIDTVRWDGFVQIKRENWIVDTLVMSEEKVVRCLRPGRKIAIWGLGLTAVPAYSFLSGIAFSYLVTSVITISVFSYALLGLAPIGITLLAIGLIKRRKSKKALVAE